MNFNLVLIFAFLMVANVHLNTARADDATANELKALRQRVEELERKLEQLEKLRPTSAPSQTNNPALEPHPYNTQPKASDALAEPATIVTAGAQGLSFGSSNGDFKVQFKGLLQVDSRTFFQDSGIVGNDTILLRRARPIIQGTLFRDFDFQFVPDFGLTGGPQIFDAWINYRYNDSFQLQAGKYKPPVGLEMLQPDPYTLFNERSLATDLVPNRDLGFDLHGDLWHGLVSYAVGVFNGVGDARVSSNGDFEDNKEFAGRVIFQPFALSSIPALRGLGFGLSGTYETTQKTNTAALPATTGGSLPGYATDGQQQFFAYNPASNAVVVANGEHWRLSPQGYYFYGPFALLGEYVISDQRVSRSVTAPFASARLKNSGWELSGAWMITCEHYTYGSSVVPRHAFNPREGGWGAWQVVARYAELSIDPQAFPLFSDPTTSAHTAESFSIGVNWYLNRDFCLKTSFSHTDFQGGGQGTSLSAPAAVSRKAENVLFTRLQLNF